MPEVQRLEADLLSAEVLNLAGKPEVVLAIKR